MTPEKVGISRSIYGHWNKQAFDLMSLIKDQPLWWESRGQWRDAWARREWGTPGFSVYLLPSSIGFSETQEQNRVQWQLGEISLIGQKSTHLLTDASLNGLGRHSLGCGPPSTSKNWKRIVRPATWWQHEKMATINLESSSWLRSSPDGKWTR